MKNFTYLKALPFLILLLTAYLATAQVGTPFSKRYDNRLKGELTFLSNNIVSKDDNTISSNDPYNGNENNNGVNVEYIDVDSDPTTFSSSTSALDLPGCYKIRYAGLYWSAIYPFDRGFSGSDSTGDGIVYPYTSVKVSVPGQAYADVTGTQIYYGSPTGRFHETSYVCYADITNLVTPLADPTGAYTVANVRATQGRKNGGSGGGWIIVIVYENPALPGKYISTFDGYAAVTGRYSNTPPDPTSFLDFGYSGFTTIPTGPVRARIGIGTLEGDRSLVGDQMLFKADLAPTFTNLFNAGNPITNFFNANITNDGLNVTTRTPNSTNTLGFDADIFNLANPGNSLITNNETGATIRVLTDSDGYGVFLNTLSIEIIEPTIILKKGVEDLSGTDIQGGDVTLGQLLDYVLTFQNIGNDNAVNYTIRDVLPTNVDIVTADIVLPPGVTYTYDPVAHAVTFTIPNNLVEIGDPEYEIRLRVKVLESCGGLRDACSNIIQNQAFSTYQGDINPTQITDDPSFSDFDVCGFGTPGSTNFLVGLDDCNFTRTEILCGDSITLTAGNGFVAYEWRDSGGNIIGTTQSITVSSTGTYTVRKTAPAPCVDFDEIVNVVLFNASAPNPIIPYADEVSTCPNDGDTLPKLFLCGEDDSRTLNVSISDATSIRWEKLDETSCPAVGLDDCANKNNTCTWNEVQNGPIFTVSDAGQYRLVVQYQNGCFNRYYFNVYKNNLDPNYTKEDITCAGPGEIRVTNVPNGYEYQLIDAVTNAVLVAYQNSPVFTITSAGSYTVQIRQTGVVDGCVFRLENISILNRPFEVDVIIEAASCNGFGSVRVQINNAAPQYYYEIRQGATLVDSFGPSSDNDYTFTNLLAGNYTVTARNDEGCVYTEDVVVDPYFLGLEARVSQNITCREGNILVNPIGGQPPHLFAIYSYNGVLQNPTSTDYQTSNIFDIYNEGVYEFIVIDRNNCTAVSNPVTIYLVPSVEYNTELTNISCAGANNGTYRVNITNRNGYIVSFTLLYPDGTTTVGNSSGFFNNLSPGTYTLTIHQRKGNRTCDFVETFTITEPAPLTGNAELLSGVSCPDPDGGSIGVVSGSVTGGTPPYQYSIDGVNFSASTVFNNLLPGNYTIIVRDANGCLLPLNTLTIDPTNPPTDLQFSATEVTCPAEISNVTVTVVNGTAPFNYEIIAPAPAIASIPGSMNTSETFTNLSPGTYTFRVTDADGCIIEETFTIPPLVPPVISSVVEVGDILCAGGTTTIRVNIDFTAGVGPFEVFVDGVSYGTQTLISGLGAGTYSVTIEDAKNCVSSAVNITITEPTPLNANISSVPVTCVNPGVGQVPGSVTIDNSTAGGTAPYDYYIYDSANVLLGQSLNTTALSFTVNNLPFGLYYGVVVDANGCEQQLGPIFVESLNDLDIDITQITADCTVGGTVRVTVPIGSGVGPFRFRIYPSGTYVTPNVDPRTHDFFGLTPGVIYTFDVIDDGTNCTYTEQAPGPVDSASNLNSTVTGVPVTCTGAGDGQASFSFSNWGAGTTTLTYEIFPVGADPSTATPVDSGSVAVTAAQPIAVGTLPPGTYFIVFTENGSGPENGCSTQSPPFTITQPTNLLTVAASLSTNVCAPLAGIINATAQFGTPPYQFSIDGVTFQASNLFDIVDTGAVQNITVTARDANNCEQTTIVNVNPLPVLSALVTSTVPFSCSGPEEVTISVTNGSGDFTYTLLPNGPSQVNNPVFTLGGPGSYQFQVTDNTTGCFVLTAPFDVLPYTVVDVVATSTSPVSCFGATDGEITINITNYSGNYTYQLYDNLGNPVGAPGSANTSTNPFTISGLAAGLYYVEVISADFPFCDALSNTVTIASPASPLVVSLQEGANVTCDNNSGEIIALASGGWGSYEYEFVNLTTATTLQAFGPNNILTGLSAGLYQVTARDAENCTSVATVELLLPLPITVNVSATNTNLLCFGDTNATITASATGGFGAYQYILNFADGTSSGAQTNPTFTGLGAGTYTVTVTDGFNCDATSGPIVITEPTPIQPLLTLESGLTCDNLGSLRISASGGTAPYFYSFDNVSFSPFSSGSTHLLTNIGQGVYQVYVTDANNCTAVLTNQVSMDEVPLLALNLNLDTAIVRCVGDATGAIEAVATGGLGNYLYTLRDASNNVLAGPQASGFFEGLVAGTYYVFVTSGDCELLSPPIEITEPQNPLIIVNSAFSNISCDGQNDGRILVEASGGTGVIKYAISPNLNQFDTVNEFTGLASGNYQVLVQDEAGCYIIPLDFTIVQPEPVAATANVTNPIVCNDASDGTIEVVITGGTAPYFTSLNTQDDANFVQDQFIFTDLAGGQTYVIFVKDSAGCETNVIVELGAAPSLAADVVTEYACVDNENANSVTVTLTGGTDPSEVMYALDSTDPNDLQLENTFINVAPGDHYVTVAHVTSGCFETINFSVDFYETLELTLVQSNNNEITATATGGTGVYEFFLNGRSRGSTRVFNISETGTYEVRVVDANGCERTAQIFMEFINICIPDFFTPDGDGTNDTWGPCNEGSFPNLLIRIYDRYGRLVAELNPDKRWDGRYNGNPLPSGDYWYLVYPNGENDPKTFMGHFTLLR